MPQPEPLADMGYPRPMLRRQDWQSLNGPWDFVIDHDAHWEEPDQVCWGGQTIQVPFSPETPLSGIGDDGLYRSCWYRRRVNLPLLREGERYLLHFGAVDHCATVWLNGLEAARHEGGYTPIEIDITKYLEPGPQEIIVRAEDDPHDLSKPRGKQDWQRDPHSIWYPRTTGIWQPVWVERVPETWIGSVHWTPNVERWQIAMEARIDGHRRNDLRLEVRLSSRGVLLAEDTYSVMGGEVLRRISLTDPGIDDYRNQLLWSPATPTLIDCELRLITRDGRLLDCVESYTALRVFSIQGDRFLLNGRPFPLFFVLDQGYWPESGLTAPSDAHYQRDVELAKAMGFNGVRKHQKVESPRYLYWADKLGLLVWTEMPSAYRFNRESVQRLTREWTQVIARDRSHPCICAWVPFNESWGVPDLPDSPAQRHYVQALYHLTKTLDATRPVIGNDGWESVATDIIGIHDYDEHPERLAARYGLRSYRLFERERPAGRQLLIGTKHKGQPIVLTEFGGIAYSDDLDRTWGYSRTRTPKEYAERYAALLRVVRPAPLLAGFCYTQFADTYQEANGLLYADRRPKFPVEEIALATRGPRGVREMQWDWYYREQTMAALRARGPEEPGANGAD